MLMIVKQYILSKFLKNYEICILFSNLAFSFSKHVI